MAKKTNDLKFFLESSLNEIFKATVSDILDSVDRTLCEYQGTIHRIESENEGLKRRLLAHESRESAARVGKYQHRSVCVCVCSLVIQAPTPLFNMSPAESANCADARLFMWM